MGYKLLKGERKMDEELDKIVDTYYEDGLETYNEVEIRRTKYNND